MSIAEDVRPAAVRPRDLVDLALSGARANDRPDLIRRLAGVERELDAAVAGEAVTRAERGAAREVLRAADSLAVDLRARRAMFSDPGRAARLGAELADSRQRRERFETSARDWPHVLGDGFATVSSDLEFHVRARFSALLAEGDRLVNGMDPAKDRREFDARLRARLVEEADRTYELLWIGAHRVAGELAGLLDLPGPLPVGSVPVMPSARLVAELPDRQPTSAGAPPIPARLLSVLMPGYGGLMMALVISRFAGLELPGWLIVTLAVLGALTLGGAAVSGERKRQLDRRRAETMAAVRGTLEEFQLALLKQVRDATRALQRDLRATISATVARLGAALNHELDTVRTATESAQGHSTEICNISDDLTLLADLRRRALEVLSTS